MPYMVMGLAGMFIAGLSLAKDIFTDSKSTASVMTPVIVIVVLAYLIHTGKLKVS